MLSYFVFSPGDEKSEDEHKLYHNNLETVRMLILENYGQNRINQLLKHPQTDSPWSSFQYIQQDI